MGKLSSDLWDKLRSSKDKSAAQGAVFDFARDVSYHATERGVIRGELGKYLAGKSYGDLTGRCVAVCTTLPDGAKLQNAPASVYDEKLGWANCSERECSTPGWSGWMIAPRQDGQAVCGVFNNWSDVRRVWVAVDVRYRP